MSFPFSISSIFQHCPVHRVPLPQAWLQGPPTQMLNLLHLGCSMKEPVSLLLSLLLLWHSEWKLLELMVAPQMLQQQISIFFFILDFQTGIGEAFSILLRF